MKRVKKIFLVILILIISLSGVVLAAGGKGDVGPIIDRTQPTVTGNSRFIDVANVIIGGIQVICAIASVLITIIDMLGSTEERADYKGKAIRYIIGAAMLFGITSILGIISSMMK